MYFDRSNRALNNRVRYILHMRAHFFHFRPAFRHVILIKFVYFVVLQDGK